MHVPRRDRALVFREFVLQTFSQEYLRSGVVLDVAGGRGDLSWLLANADGVDSVVVDPRATDHKKIERTALWHWEHRNEDAARLVEARGPQGVLGALRPAPPFVAPRQLQVPLDERLLQALAAEEAEAGSWAAFWREASASAGATGQEGAPPEEQREVDEARSSPQVREAAAALELIRGVRLLLGFHPDQATEACVDLALRLRVPFAVCPCCVFPACFPRRRLAGRPVKTYEDFVEYLRRKHPGMQATKLPFDDDSGAARNVVLLMRSEDFAAGLEDVPPPPLPLAGATGRPARPRPIAKSALSGPLAAWAELAPGAGGSSSSTASAGGSAAAGAAEALGAETAVPAEWEHCLWRAAADHLAPRELLALGRVGPRWHSACFLMSLYKQQLPVRRRFFQAERAGLLEALAAFRRRLESSEVTGLFHPDEEAGVATWAWKQLNTDLSAGVSKGLPADFGCRRARAEYFLRHLPTRCWHLPHLLLSEEPLLQRILRELLFPLDRSRSAGELEGSASRCRVRVASLGGGPGYDAIGLALLAAQQRLRVSFEVANLDHEPDWEEVVRAADAHLCAPLGHAASFGHCDIVAGLEREGPNSYLASEVGPEGAGFDAFVVAFVVATNAQRLEATNFRFFRELFAAVRPGVSFFFMDATHRTWAQLVAAAADGGDFEVSLPQFERGKGLHGFPKHSLVLRKRAARGHSEAASASAAELLARCEEHRQAHGRRQVVEEAAEGAAEEEEEEDEGEEDEPAAA